VRGTNRFLSAKTDEVVLVVVGKSQHLVRDDVSNVDDEIPCLVHEHGIEINWNFPVGFACRRFRNLVRWNRSNPDHSSTPVVGVDAIVRNRAEHPAIFRCGVRQMLSQCWDDVGLTRCGKQPIERFRYPACAAVRPGEIGRQQQHPSKVAAQPATCFLEQALAHGLDLGT
jgi:hypothetical protein